MRQAHIPGGGCGHRGDGGNEGLCAEPRVIPDRAGGGQFCHRPADRRAKGMVAWIFGDDTNSDSLLEFRFYSLKKITPNMKWV